MTGRVSYWLVARAHGDPGRQAKAKRLPHLVGHQFTPRFSSTLAMPSAPPHTAVKRRKALHYGPGSDPAPTVDNRPEPWRGRPAATTPGGSIAGPPRRAEEKRPPERPCVARRNTQGWRRRPTPGDKTPSECP